MSDGGQHSMLRCLQQAGVALRVLEKESRLKNIALTEVQRLK